MRQNSKDVDELISILKRAAADSQLLRDFLTDLLTPTELHEVASRWQIVKQLDREVPQWEITNHLRVGIGTVERGVRMLRAPDGGFNQMLRRLRSR